VRKIKRLIFLLLLSITTFYSYQYSYSQILEENLESLMVDPIISNIKIINRTFMDEYGVNSVDNSGTVYVKDEDRVKVSFDVKNFSMNEQEKMSNKKGGYLLEFLNGYSNYTVVSNDISISNDPNTVDTYTVTYIFDINDTNLNEKDINIKFIVKDKAGNEGTAEERIVLANDMPKVITIKLYEEVKDWNNIITGRSGDRNISESGYKFTKGGPTSLIQDPIVYVEVTGTTGEDVRYLRVEKNGNTSEPLLDILNQTTEIKIDGSNGVKFRTNVTNMVKITPISISGVVGNEVILNFVIDTKVNTSYLESGIIGNLLDKHIVIDLSKLKELVGVEGYSYRFMIGNENKVQNTEDDLNGNSFIISTEGSISKTIDIDSSSFQGGSRVNLYVTVWDRLGNEKIFKKSYFIPTDTLGIKASIEGESKVRESKIKIIGEGENNKFQLESNVDKSKE
jgi:hypothetical protein